MLEQGQIIESLSVPIATGAEDPFSITVLQAPPYRPQGKVIRPEGSKPLFPPLVWGVWWIRCEDPLTLYRWLLKLEREPRAVLIRGCPPAGVGAEIPDPRALGSYFQSQAALWENAAPWYKRLQRVRRVLRGEKATSLDEDARATLKEEEAVAEASLAELGWYPRTKAFFREVPRRWVWLDLDEGFSHHQGAPPRGLVAHQRLFRLIQSQGLPEAFQGRSFVAQWSSSAFLGAAQGEETALKAHLAFLLDRPLGEQALKDWHGPSGDPLWPIAWDRATFRAVQPHYTAAPRFQGITDPLAGERLFLLSGHQSYVETPSVECGDSLEIRQRNKSGTKSDGLFSGKAGKSRAKEKLIKAPSLSPLPPPLQGHTHNEGSALKEREKASPTSAETVTAERALEAQRLRLAEGQRGGRNLTMFRAACALGPHLARGALEPRRAEQTLLSAAESCGLVKEQGRADCLRQIRNGLRIGFERSKEKLKVHETLSEGQQAIFEQIDTAAEPHVDQSAQPKKTQAKLEEVTSLSIKDSDYQKQLRRYISAAQIQALQSPERIPVLALTCGGGKTTALIEEVVDALRRAETRIVLCRNHEMAAAFAERVEAQTESWLWERVQLLKGIQFHCRVLKEASEPTREKMKLALRHGRRALCGKGESRCQYAVTCPGAERPQALPRQLTIATHSMAPFLQLPPDALVLIDELPSPIRCTVFKAHHFKNLQLHDESQRVLPILDDFECWLRAQVLLQRIAELIEVTLKEAPKLYQEELSRGSYSLSEAEALSLFSTAREQLRQFSSAPALRLPSPAPRLARQGRLARSYPSPTLLATIRHLAAGVSAGRWPQELSLVIQRRGGQLELREVNPLPDAPIVALDGTAHRTTALWEHLAHGIEREVDLWPIAAHGEAPRSARWLKTQQLRSPQLIHRGDGGEISWRRRALGTLRRVTRAIDQAAEQAQLPSAAPIGVLAAKHVADLFRRALGEPARPAFQEEGELVDALKEVVRENLKGRTLIIGHIGAHDIGSNLFEEVRLLAMLGSSKPDWGATLNDLRALGIDEETSHEVYTRIVAARDVQALARARHLRRSGVSLLYIGDMTPPSGHDLPDVHWEEENSRGRLGDRGERATEERARALLLSRGQITLADLMEEFKLQRGAARGVLKRLRRDLQLREWTRPALGRGRPVKVYGLPLAEGLADDPLFQATAPN